MRLSIATKVFLGFSAVLVSSGLVSVYGIVRMHRIGQGLSLVSSGYFPLTRVAGSLEAFQKEREWSTGRLLEEQDPAARKSLIAALDRAYFARVVGGRLTQARELIAAAKVSADARDQDSLERIDARLLQVAARMADEEKAAAAVTAALLLPAAQRRGAPAEMPEVAESVARLKAVERRVDFEIKTLLGAIQDRMNEVLAEAERQERAARWAVAGLAVLALGIGLFVTWRSNRALRPIARLTEAAQRLGLGAPDTVAAVPESGGDELALLAREFNAMAQRLAARERELRAQGEALVRSERLAAIGRIAAQIAHEIRNPLSSISLNAEELSEQLGGGDGVQQAKSLADAIVREVDRLTAITEEYLRFARLPKPQMGRADVNEVVRELLDFVRPELDAAGVMLTLALQPALPLVLADAGQLRQLLLNLVRNGREAMPGGGALRVSTSASDGGGVRVEVRDEGPGIPPEGLQRIFDPFFTTKERGTGLGLALAQEIAHEHGGRLAVESAPGKGSAFTLTIPPAPPPLAESAEALRGTAPAAV